MSEEEDTPIVLDENAIYRYRIVINKTIDDYEKIAKAMTQHFKRILDIEKIYCQSFQQLYPNEGMNASLSRSNSKPPSIFELSKESEYDKDINIKECVLKLKKDLSDRIEQSKSLVNYLEINVIQQISSVQDQMEDMRNSFNRIVDQDLTSSRIESLQNYDQANITFDNLLKWSQETTEALDCLVTNSRNKSKFCSRRITDIAYGFMKNYSISKNQQFISDIVNGFILEPNLQLTSRKSLFEETNLINLKEVHNQQLKQLLKRSRNISKIIKQGKVFTSENIEERAQQANVSQRQEYLDLEGVRESQQETEQLGNKPNGEFQQTKDPFYSYETEIQDLKNVFQESLKQKFSQPSFEHIVYCLCGMKISQSEKYSREEKSQSKDTLIELFGVSKEEDVSLQQILIGFNNSNNDDSILSSSSTNGTILTSKIRNFMSMISVMSSFRSPSEQIEKQTNLLEILVGKFIAWPAAEQLPPSSPKFLKEFLQNLLIVIALNNQWNSQSTVSIDSPEFEQTAELFADLAKIFFCNLIKAEDILLNLRELTYFQVLPITYPLSFQITKTLILKFILPFRDDDLSQSNIQMLHPKWKEGYKITRDFCETQLRLNEHTLNLILIYECYMSFIRKLKGTQSKFFLPCLSEISLNFKYPEKIDVSASERIIQKQLSESLVLDFKAVLSNIHSYITLGFAQIQQVCLIYDYFLSFATGNDISTKKKTIEGQFANFGKNMAFEISKRFDATNSLQKDKFFCLNVSQESIAFSGENELSPRQLSPLLKGQQSNQLQINQIEPETTAEQTLKLSPRSDSPPNESLENQQKQQTPSEQLAQNSLEVSVYFNDSEVKQDDAELLNSKKEIPEDKSVTYSRALGRIAGILKMFTSERDSSYILSSCLHDFQRELGYSGNELILIFVDNLLQEFLEELKSMAQYKEHIPSSSHQFIFEISLELQKFDKIAGFSRESSYLEAIFPLFSLWTTEYKKRFASAVDKCLETEEWVQKKIEGEITYHSPCCENFVNIFLETIEDLVLIGCSQSFRFQILINDLADTIAKDTCQYFCEIMLSSLDELKKYIEEGNLIPIDKFNDEIFNEEINELEDNCKQHRKFEIEMFILRRLCLRLGNMRYLSDKVNQSSHFKSLGVFEVLNDIIETTSKKVSEVIGNGFVIVFLKNLFDCYLLNFDVFTFDKLNIQLFSQSLLSGADNLLPRFKPYFALLSRRVPKKYLPILERIVVSQFERQLIICFSDINKLYQVTDQKKLADFLRSELEVFLAFLRHYFSEQLTFQEVYTIAVLYQKDTSDLIVQISNLKISNFDKKVAFRVLYMRKKYDKIARHYAKTVQHLYLQKKKFKINRFLNS